MIKIIGGRKGCDGTDSATRQYCVKDGAKISLLNPAIGYGPNRSKIYHALIDVIKCLEEEQSND